MVELFAWSRGMANANWPILLWYQHPHDGLAKGADEGVLLILLIDRDINLFSELIYFILFFTSSQLDRPQNNEITLSPLSPLVVPPALLSSIAPGCFSLVVVCVIVWRPPKAMVYFILLIFLSIYSMTERTTRHPPTRSTLAASPLQCTSHPYCQLALDCCIVWPNGNHLQPRPCPSLYLFLLINSTTKAMPWCPPASSAMIASSLQCPPLL
jgi:hypothetical protein